MERQIYNVVRPREGDDGKTYWDKHGVLIIREGKISLHVASVPTGEWDGWFHVYPREEKEPAQGSSRPSHLRVAARNPAPVADFDDDIPFA